MRVRVLGSVELEGEPGVPIGGPTQRRILALLALHHDDVVSVDRLIDATWSDGDVPRRAEHNVRSYVHRLRATLGGGDEDRIETAAPGYRLHLEPDELDLARFDRAVSVSARQVEIGDSASALDAIDTATTLWRGRPF